MNFKFEVGSEVVDSISGYSGIIIYRSQWLSNCNTYGVKSKEIKDGRPIEPVQFDEPQLNLIEPDVIEKNQDTGGCCGMVERTNRI